VGDTRVLFSEVLGLGLGEGVAERSRGVVGRERVVHAGGDGCGARMVCGKGNGVKMRLALFGKVGHGKTVPLALDVLVGDLGVGESGVRKWCVTHGITPWLIEVTKGLE